MTSSSKLELTKKEKEFDLLINQYKNLYLDYIQNIKNQVKRQWNITENATVKSDAGFIEDEFLPTISKEECIKACETDKQCNYILFSDGGTGSCAANQCLKWTKDAVGIINSNTNNIQKNPSCSDPYKYMGWSKPVWSDMENTSIMPLENNSSSNWDLLGKSNTLNACRSLTMDSSKSYDSVVFFSGKTDEKWQNKCYGGVGTNISEKQAMEGAYTSIAPTNYIPINNSVSKTTLPKLQALNKTLQTVVNDIKKLTNTVYPDGISSQNKNFNYYNKIFDSYSKLTNDRTELDKLENELTTVNASNESSAIRYHTYYYRYLAYFLILIAIIYLIFIRG